MPAPLKGALVRETARRGSNLNDVAVGILADRLQSAVHPERPPAQVLAGSSPVLLLRVPQALKDEIQAEAMRSKSNANDVVLAALAESASSVVPQRCPSEQRKGTHGRHHRLQERQRTHEGQGARRDHRRRQLRQLPAPGCRVLQGREGRRVRPRPDARRSRRVPHPRYRVHLRFRRRQGEGRRRPRRRDLGVPERHDQVRRRPEDRDQGLARDDARRDRQVPRRGRGEGSR